MIGNKVIIDSNVIIDAVRNQIDIEKLKLALSLIEQFIYHCLFIF